MAQDISRSIEACAAHYGEDADAMRDYLIEGQARALALPNRGPIRFDAGGDLHPDIKASYLAHGFYVFENVITEEELSDIKDDLKAMRANFPVHMGAELDSTGQPALGVGHAAPNLQWARPLSDPLGATDISNGRHPVKLFEPRAADNAPPAVPLVVLGSLQFSPACLRTYAHPQLLKIAESINGKDFSPFNETLFIKDPGLGAAVSWHQDGDTHYNDNFDETVHGFNFMAQVYGSTAVNGVWAVPGSHKLGRVDIRKWVEEAGSERLPAAVPMICNPGDVVISNRQLVHGSFANTGFEPRVTVNFGFHRRSSVLNVKGAGIHSEAVVYDEAYITERARVIGLGINARAQRFPHETPYQYQPLAGREESYIWSPEVQASLKDYNLKDVSI